MDASDSGARRYVHHVILLIGTTSQTQGGEIFGAVLSLYLAKALGNQVKGFIPAGLFEFAVFLY